MNEKKCPLDGFELVMLVSDKVSYSLCPKCYNDSTKTSALTCANCPKVDCRENLGRNKFALCPKCSGDILLIDVKPKYFILCKDCMLASPLCKGCSKISVTKNQCNGCSGLEIKIEYTKNSPFKETVKEGCLNCDIEIFNQTELAPGQ